MRQYSIDKIIVVNRARDIFSFSAPVKLFPTKGKRGKTRQTGIDAQIPRSTMRRRALHGIDVLLLLALWPLLRFPVRRSFARIYVTRRRCSYHRSQILIRWRALVRTSLRTDQRNRSRRARALVLPTKAGRARAGRVE